MGKLEFGEGGVPCSGVGGGGEGDCEEGIVGKWDGWRVGCLGGREEDVS